MKKTFSLTSLILIASFAGAQTALPAGTAVKMKLETTLATFSSKAGDPFSARVTAPVVVDGKTVIPDPGNVMWFHSNGDVYLTAGPHKIDAGERNLEGDAIMKLSWQPPGQPLEIVPSSNLLPAESHGK